MRSRLLIGIVAVSCLLLGVTGIVIASVIFVTGIWREQFPVFGIGGLALFLIYGAIGLWLRADLRKRADG